MSGWLASSCSSVPLDLIPIILKCLQRCPIGNSNPYEAQIFAYTVLATCPCLFMYTVPACSLHPATMCCTALGAPLDSLQPGSCQVRKRLLTLCCCIGPSQVHVRCWGTRKTSLQYESVRFADRSIHPLTSPNANCHSIITSPQSLPLLPL